MPEAKRDFRIYHGSGEDNHRPAPLVPLFEKPDRFTNPAYYIAGPGLRDAVNVALLLGQPILLTGDPGTGKTHLAYSLASELRLPGPFTFHTKTTSSASDLFYTYDALRHFHSRERPALDFIAFRALGLAILSAGDPERSNRFLGPSHRIDAPRRSVVLIDEIDKAPRDLPNDVLDEIENMRFRVPEIDETFEAEQKYRPIVVLTSNSEKDLPEPFLRRCVYYHILFPSDEELRRIIANRLPEDTRLTEERIKQAVASFYELRKRARKKLPATAELLAWLQVLERLDLDPNPEKLGQQERELLGVSYSVLFKSKEDLERERERLRG